MTEMMVKKSNSFAEIKPLMAGFDVDSTIGRNSEKAGGQYLADGDCRKSTLAASTVENLQQQCWTDFNGCREEKGTGWMQQCSSLLEEIRKLSFGEVFYSFKNSNHIKWCKAFDLGQTRVNGQMST